VTEQPYRIANISPYPHEDEYDSGDYSITLNRCLDEIRWPEKTKLQGKLIDGRYHGLAVGCFIEGGAAGPKESARLDDQRRRLGIRVHRLVRCRARRRDRVRADRR